MNASQSFGDWVKQQRRRLDLSQTDLAARISYSVDLLRKVEQGRQKPSRALAKKLVQALQVPESEHDLWLNFARGLSDKMPGESATHSASDLLPFEPLIGRQQELNYLLKTIRNPQCRLLTVTGLSGIGKTRLALKAVHTLTSDFPDGVLFVPLAGTVQADLVVLELCAYLGLRNIGSMDAEAVLIRHLQRKELLLVLDNFEHVLDAAPLLERLLHSIPTLKCLVTSILPLDLSFEWRLPLGGLRVEHNPQCDAVRYFLQRATQTVGESPIEQHFEAVYRIVRALDGSPLGLELAASALTAISCSALADQLEQDIDVLVSSKRDRPERHHSMTAMLQRTWSLLSSDERSILSALSVFRGGFDFPAAAAVTGASFHMLRDLVDKSLVRFEPDNNRYILHEQVRLYASMRPEHESHSTHLSHFRYFYELSQQAQPELEDGDQIVWMARIERDFDNIQAALSWCLTQPQHHETGMQLLGNLYWFWQVRSVQQGRYWCEAFLLHADPRTQTEGYGWILFCRSGMAFFQGQYVIADQYLQRSIAIFRALQHPKGLCYSLAGYSQVLFCMGRLDEAYDVACAGIEIAHALNFRLLLVMAHAMLAQINCLSNNLELAEHNLTVAQTLRAAIQNTSIVTYVHFAQGDVALKQGNYVRARDNFAEAVKCYAAIGDVGQRILALDKLLYATRMFGDHDAVATISSELSVLNRFIGKASSDEAPM
jgi:predicted ATPase/DNA-binding XRE family transcriptional regulator